MPRLVGWAPMDTKGLHIRNSRWGFAVFDGDVKLTPWQRDRGWVESRLTWLQYALSDEGQAWARSVLDQSSDEDPTGRGVA